MGDHVTIGTVEREEEEWREGEEGRRRMGGGVGIKLLVKLREMMEE